MYSFVSVSDDNIIDIKNPSCRNLKALYRWSLRRREIFSRGTKQHSHPHSPSHADIIDKITVEENSKL